MVAALCLLGPSAGRGQVLPPAPAPAPEVQADATPTALGPDAMSRALGLRLDSQFVKGELASIGAIGFVPWENRVGGILGVERLGPIWFALLKPEINYTMEILDRPFTLSFGIPLRLQLYDTRPDGGWSYAGHIRSEDWNRPQSYAQVIQAIRWGGKEKHFFLDIDQFRASTIGHGLIMRRYNQNMDFNIRRVSAELDVFSDFGGGELYLNDITRPNVLGGLLFIKPLSFIDRENSMMRSFSIGATFMADVDAPLRNRLDLNDVDNNGRRTNQVLVDQDHFLPQYVSTAVLAYGVDAELKLLDQDGVDWKTYIDYSFLQSGVPKDDGGPLTFNDIPTRAVRSSGFAWGHLVRMNFGSNPVHALRFRVEFRTYQPNYLPGYFDVLYDVQRVQYLSGSGLKGAALANNTKLVQVLGRDPDGPWCHGGYLEASYRIGDFFAFAFGLEMNNRTADNGLFVHVEVPRLWRWQFMATYFRRGATDFADLWKWFQGGNDLFIAKTRLYILEWFAVSVEAMTPFGIDSQNFFRSTLQINGNLEFSYPYIAPKSETAEAER